MGDFRGTKRTKAAGMIPQDEHLAVANLKKVSVGVQPFPSAQIAPVTTAIKVGKGNMVRVRTTAASFVNCGPSTIGAVDGTEQTSLELNAAGVYVLVASDDYMRFNVAPARIEVITG